MVELQPSKLVMRVRFPSPALLCPGHYEFLLLCSHYDPISGHYGRDIIMLLKITGTLTVLILAATIGILSLRYRTRPVDQPGSPESQPMANA